MKLIKPLLTLMCIIGQCSALAAPKSTLQNHQHRNKLLKVSAPSCDNAEYILAKGLSSQVEGQTQKAIGYYRTAILCSPNDFMGHLFLAELLYDQNHLQEAIKETKKVLWLKPDYTLEHLRLGNMLNQTGDKAGAVKEWKTVLLLGDDEDSSDEAKKMLKLSGAS